MTNKKITYVYLRDGDACPNCGEFRITDDIHEHVSFVCGYSTEIQNGKLRTRTKCEGRKYVGDDIVN